ncbi:MAG: hypothetical protein NC913_02885 [Candidatus Omnitrophica bacterium]|nr:hypothetical protein [Candidatus Omnitrophota bacterium]
MQAFARRCFVLIMLIQSFVLASDSAMKEIEIQVPEENCQVNAFLKAGTQKPGIAIALIYDDGRKTVISVQSSGSENQKDWFVEFPELRIKYYVRPNINFYQLGERKDELIKIWDDLPGASNTFFPFTIRKIDKRLEYWINGSYAGFNEIKTQLKRIIFRANQDAEIKDCECDTNFVSSNYLMLEISTHNNPGIMKNVKMPFSKGIQHINGIPFIIGDGENFDLGKVKNYAKAGYEIDQYLSRSPFDGLPEFLHYSVPLDQYIRAYILCATEEDREKQPVLTVRMTRYVIGGRGDAIADTTVRLDDAQSEKNIKKVGRIRYIDDKGNEKTADLFLVEAFLKIGEIQDLIFDMGGGYFRGVLPQPWYLDFEVLGKTGSLTAQWDYTHKPSNDVVSSVHIFGITLEKSPVMMKVMPSRIGNIYQKGEKPEIQVHLMPKRKGQYIISYEISDIENSPVLQWKQQIMCENETSETLIVPLKVKENGWYGLKIKLLDNQSRLLMEHPCSFAILPEDTRKLGYESPFGTWWFGNAHFGTSAPEIIGPLFLKAGFRHSCFSPAWHGKLSEKDMTGWKVTAFQVPWWRWKIEMDMEQQSKVYENYVREYLNNWPNCKYALIFHESYGGNAIPAELYDGVTKPDDKKNKEIENLTKIASSATKVLRENFPDIKIVFGNCNSVSDLAAEFFRRGYPAKNIDYFGIEAAGQTFIPEKLIEWGPQAAWFVRETGRKFGYEIPVTSCYEWIYRQDRILGLKTQAEWYVRDALIALAYRFPTISLALLYDVGNCYYNTLWGASGLLKRYPLLYPKPSYVAIANLTRVLDRAEFVKRVPTRSLTLYALEFRKDTQYIYAIWTPRGICETIISFEKDGKVFVEDLYGRSKTILLERGKVKLDAGTDVKYIISELPVKEIISGKRIFEENKAFAKSTVINRMESLSEWELIRDKDIRLEAPQRGHTPLRTLGDYTIREVTDSEMGKCLELELIPSGNVPEIMNEYTILRLKKPVNVVGKPSTIGVWVKGNSSWARVMWEIEDAEGKTFLSCGTDGWGCDILDWPGVISVNFDGWCYLQFPITKESELGYDKIVPGGVSGQWKITGKSNNKQVVYPIKIKGIAVEMTRKALDITQMLPVKNLSLRLKNLSVY